MKKRVIVVTDGDKIAKSTIERAVKNIGGRCISSSAGNPTFLDGPEMLMGIKESQGDPVVIMVDDKGHEKEGKGERVIRFLSESDELEIIGIVAVASNTKCYKGAKVDLSLTKEGKIIHKEIDKNGNVKSNKIDVIEGDTVQILDNINVPIIVGIGDPGKMEGKDMEKYGAPITTRALKIIIDHYNGKNYTSN